MTALSPQQGQILCPSPSLEMAIPSPSVLEDVCLTVPEGPLGMVTPFSPPLPLPFLAVGNRLLPPHPLGGQPLRSLIKDRRASHPRPLVMAAPRIVRTFPLARGKIACPHGPGDTGFVSGSFLGMAILAVLRGVLAAPLVLLREVRPLFP